MAHRLSQVLVLATLVLLFVGGLVTSTDSGLAVPDWPLSYGSFSPPMVGGIRFEHTHRLVAGTVGFLTLILTFWIGFTEKKPLVRRLAIACLAAVVLQGILGGLTVLYLLPPAISIAHACLGPIFFSLVVSLAVLTDPTPSPLPSPLGGEGRVRGLAMTVTFFVFLQIFLGAVVRHTNSGIWFHIASAFLVLFLTGFLVRSAPTSRPALFLGFLVTVEFFLGIGAFIFTRIPGISSAAGPVIFPTLHQTLGALILAISVLITLRTPSPQPSPLRGEGEQISPRPVCGERDRVRGGLLNLLEVTKPRLVSLVLWSITVGFLLASRGPLNFSLLAKTLTGTFLVAGGAMALNQWLERDRDARMKRTETRPLPSGRVTPARVFWFGIFLSVAGLAGLFFGVNFLTGILTVFTLLTYLLVYTPLKTKTPLAILVGAVPGALPPVIGWAAREGSLTLGAGILFVILFVWQLPHVLAIGWVHREDYARAGFPMLSVSDAGGKRSGKLIIAGTLVLLLAGLSPFFAGMNSLIYFSSALFLGTWLLISSIRTSSDLDSRAPTYFRNTVIYLSLLLFLILFTQRPS